MSTNSSKISPWKILLPTLLGFSVIVYMFYKDLFGPENAGNLEQLKEIRINGQMIFWFFVALLLMVGRDLGFTIRYRYLTEKLLSWKQALRVTLLAEFGTAVTPSSVGGSSMAILFLTKENIPVGRSTAMVFITMLLDESFFVVVFPVLLLFLPAKELFPEVSTIEIGVITLFVAAYIVKFLLCVILIIGLFIKPQAIRWLIINIFKLPILRKWNAGAIKAGDDIVISSQEIRGKKLKFWFPLILSTILSWSSRFLVINALFMAFFHVDNQLLIFGRQFVMWILMILSFTPGASGLSEIIFKEYLGALVPIVALVPIIILLWRLLSYYNYLFIGAILVPRWAKSAFSKSQDHA